MLDVDVPDDLRAFLDAGGSLAYDPHGVECGTVTLHPVVDLERLDCWVDRDGRVWPDDPHVHEKGYYVVPSVDLVATAEHYDPQGILVWIPTIKMFGSWDCDHWDIVIFPSATWDSIAADPPRYLNAQWDADGIYLKPWEHDFKWEVGRPF